MTHSTSDVRVGSAGSVRAPSRLPGRALRHLLAPSPLRCRRTIPMTTRSVQRASAAGYDTPSTRRRSNLKANGFESVAGEPYDRRVPDPKFLSASETGDAASAIGSRAERHSTGAMGTLEREGVALRGRHPDLRHMRRHTDDRISRAAAPFSAPFDATCRSPRCAYRTLGAMPTSSHIAAEPGPGHGIPTAVQRPVVQRRAQSRPPRITPTLRVP